MKTNVDEVSRASDGSVADSATVQLPPVLPQPQDVSLSPTGWCLALGGIRHPDPQSYLELPEDQVWLLHDYIMSLLLHFSPTLAEWNIQPSALEYLKERISHRAEQRTQSHQQASQCDAFDWFHRNQRSDTDRPDLDTDRAAHNQPVQSSAP